MIVYVYLPSIFLPLIKTSCTISSEKQFWDVKNNSITGIQWRLSLKTAWYTWNDLAWVPICWEGSIGLTSSEIWLWFCLWFLLIFRGFFRGFVHGFVHGFVQGSLQRLLLLLPRCQFLGTTSLLHTRRLCSRSIKRFLLLFRGITCQVQFIQRNRDLFQGGWSIHILLTGYGWYLMIFHTLLTFAGFFCNFGKMYLGI